MTNLDTSAPMTPKQKLHLQRIVGKFLYYARATDETMGHGLNNLSTKSEGTAKTFTAQQHLLNYCHCNPNTVKLYKASDMTAMLRISPVPAPRAAQEASFILAIKM